MKHLSFLTLLLFSFNTWATECPDIEGNFYDKEGHLMFAVTHWDVNKTQLFLLAAKGDMAMPFVMDGQKRDIGKLYKSQGTCEINDVKLKLAAYTEYNGNIEEKNIEFNFLQLPDENLIFTYTELQEDDVDTQRTYCKKTLETTYSCEEF